jgi:hypothetical protein
VNEMGSRVARIQEIKIAYEVSVENLEGKRRLGKRKHRWKYNIKEIGVRV